MSCVQTYVQDMSVIMVVTEDSCFLPSFPSPLPHLPIPLPHVVQVDLKLDK